MPDQDVSVPADPSTAVAPEVPDDGTGPVPGDVPPVAGDDRPVQNVVAEFNRKFGKLQEQLQSVMQMVATQHQAPPMTPPKGSPTDEELWRLAQQGDRTAFELYMERIAERKGATQLQALETSRLVDAQLTALSQRYPVFNDASHPLTQTVQATYQIMLSRGYPANKLTLLDAMKTAITDRPDLVAELHRSAATVTDATRMSATRRAQAGQTGVSARATGTPAGQPAPVTQQQAVLAARMGIKDPAEAIKRFHKRQEAGQSALGAVASAIPEDSL